MAGNAGRKLGVVQLGVLTVAALLVAGALVVKTKREAVADVPVAVARQAAQQAPAAGDDHMPKRTFGNDAIPPYQSPSDTIEDAPGASAGHDAGHDAGNAGVVLEDSAAAAPPVMKDADCSAYEGWVGKALDRAAVEATGKPHRILKPGDMMTMDFNPERINVETDEKGERVLRVFCG